MGMRIRIVLCAALVMMLSVVCAHAQGKAVQDLTGDWRMRVSGEDGMEKVLFLYIYEDGSYEIMEPEQTDTESTRGTWTFDGEVLRLSSEGENGISLEWKADAHELTGECEGGRVTLTLPIEPENAP